MRRDRGDEKQVGDVRCVPAHKSEMKSPVICEGFKRIVCASKIADDWITDLDQYKVKQGQQEPRI